MRAAITDLQPGPPTPARAALLNRLGWISWRRGQVEDAVPILERAIEEATVTGDATTGRWSTANLGSAFRFLGRGDEAVTFLKAAFLQARIAGDRALLMRCYINLPATCYGRGDPLPPLIAMADEGLVLARRAAATHTLARLGSATGPSSRGNPAGWTRPWRTVTRPSATRW